MGAPLKSARVRKIGIDRVAPFIVHEFYAVCAFAWHISAPFSVPVSLSFIFSFLKEFTWKYIFSGFNYMQCAEQHIYIHCLLDRMSMYLCVFSPLLSLVYFTVDYIVVVIVVVLTRCLISCMHPNGRGF